MLIFQVWKNNDDWQSPGFENLSIESVEDPDRDRVCFRLPVVSTVRIEDGTLTLFVDSRSYHLHQPYCWREVKRASTVMSCIVEVVPSELTEHCLFVITQPAIIIDRSEGIGDEHELPFFHAEARLGEEKVAVVRGVEAAPDVHVAPDVLGHEADQYDMRMELCSRLEVAQVRLVDAIGPDAEIENLDRRVHRWNTFRPVLSQRDVRPVREGITERGDAQHAEIRLRIVLTIIAHSGGVDPQITGTAEPAEVGIHYQGWLRRWSEESVKIRSRLWSKGRPVRDVAEPASLAKDQKAPEGNTLDEEIDNQRKQYSNEQPPFISRHASGLSS